MDYQSNQWGRDFGAEYTRRNLLSLENVEKEYIADYGFSRSALNDEALRNMSLPQEPKILEIGCNIGNQLGLLAARGFKNLYGVDVSEYAVSLAKSRYPGIWFELASGDDLPFKSNTFDLVFTSRMLIHVRDDKLGAVLDELIRVCRPGGYIWGLEYFAPVHEERVYRGRDNLLWRGDFSRLLLRRGGVVPVWEKVYKYVSDDNRDCNFVVLKL